MKISKKSNVNVYLSGPMRGFELFNRPAFDEAAAELRERGFTVHSPPEHETPTEEELIARDTSRQRRQAYLSKDIDVIQEWADAVVVLPGWEGSEGAKMEVVVAQAIGVPVFEYPNGTMNRRRVVMRVE